MTETKTPEENIQKSMKFSKWMKWNDRDNNEKIKIPGIYAIAISETDLSENDFTFIEEITYFGMTNAKTGLWGRLKAFDRTIKGGGGHGGASRFRFEHIVLEAHQDDSLNVDNLVKELIDKLYVAVLPFECDARTDRVEDLRIMGEVTKAEYDCFAEYVQNWEKLPKFNDKANSPKTLPQYEKLLKKNSKK